MIFMLSPHWDILTYVIPVYQCNTLYTSVTNKVFRRTYIDPLKPNQRSNLFSRGQLYVVFYLCRFNRFEIVLHGVNESIYF